jgi:ethanolamine utilization protein EutA
VSDAENERDAEWLKSFFQENGPWQPYRYAGGSAVDPLDVRIRPRRRRDAPERPRQIEISGPTGDRLTFTSVGIVVGSCSTQVSFYRIVMQLPDRLPGGRFLLADHALLYESPVFPTPYTGELIDGPALSDLVSNAYHQAGMQVENVQTGAVLMTGLAAATPNGPAVSTLLAEQAGSFVSAMSGVALEAALAAHGSGAVARSVGEARAARTVLNIDIGGARTKLALCRGGRVVATTALDIGGRLLALDPEGRLLHTLPAATQLAAALGIDFAVGSVPSEDQKAALARLAADAIVASAGLNPRGKLESPSFIGAPLVDPGPIDEIVVSGGVAEYLAGGGPADHRDLGVALGSALDQAFSALGVRVAPAARRIQATVEGAALYTLQLSSSTIFVSAPTLLPRRNLRVVSLPRIETPISVEAVSTVLTRAMASGGVGDGEDAFAIGISWSIEPRYAELKALAQGIATALPQTVAQRRPIVLVFGEDLGHSMGCLLTEEVLPGHHVVALDQVQLDGLDYIDVGEPIERANAVPIVVKSLDFGPQRIEPPGTSVRE